MFVTLNVSVLLLKLIKGFDLAERSEITVKEQKQVVAEVHLSAELVVPSAGSAPGRCHGSVSADLPPQHPSLHLISNTNDQSRHAA